MGDWIQSLQGRKVTPRELRPEQVGTIDEIATVLARKPRFTGHTTHPYSVAEHCVRGARALPAAFAGAFLLHELSEVYLPDIPAPIKPYLSISTDGTGDEWRDTLIRWQDLEDQHLRVMLEILGLSSMRPLIYSPEVARMDLVMLATEKRDLMGPEPEPWGLTVEPLTEVISRPCYGPDMAAGLFLQEFERLFR